MAKQRQKGTQSDSSLRTFCDSLKFKQLDILGAEFQLKYTKEGSFQTNLGAVFSLILVLTVLLAAYVTTQNFISTQSPEVSISTKYSLKSPKFDLVKENIIIPLTIATNMGPLTSKANPNGVNKYATIIGFIQKNLVNEQTGREERRNVLVIRYKPCHQIEQKISWFLDLFKGHKRSYDLIQNFGLCPEITKESKDYFVDSKFQDPPSYQLRVFIFPCSLPDASQCEDLSQIKDKTAVIGIVKKGFDASNLTNPVSVFPEFDGIQDFDMKIHKRSYYKLKKNEIWDQRMDFFDPKLRLEYADYALDYSDYKIRDETQKHCDYSLLLDPDQDECVPYFSYVFNGSSEKMIITRKYPMFFGSLGEIGGTAEIISLVLMMLYGWYNQYFLGEYVRGEVFDEETKKEFKAMIKMAEKGKKKGVRDSGEVERVGYGDNQRIEQFADYLEGRGQRESSKDSEKNNAVVLESGELEGLLDSTIEERESGMRLIKILNELEALKAVLLKPRHERLIPALILHLKKIERIKIKTRKKPITTSKILPKKLIDKENSKTSKMTLKEAYSKLSSSKHRNPLERMIDSFMKQNLKPYFNSHPPPSSFEPERRTILSTRFTEENQRFKLPSLKLGGLNSKDMLGFDRGSRNDSDCEKKSNGQLFVPSPLLKFAKKRGGRRGSRSRRRSICGPRRSILAAKEDRHTVIHGKKSAEDRISQNLY